MHASQPSRTALAAARHRAAHQILEQGRIFSDPLALRILGEDAQALARQARQRPWRRAMRIFIALRTRFAQDALAAAVERGVRQAVVLGAGLDTYAYRSPYGDRLRIFEVDHPATQAWKLERLAGAAIPIPSALTFAPVDFERATLAQGLAAAGFDPAQRTFFIWLGVVPYLSRQAVWSTLGFIASLPNGAHVVFDYSDPPHTLADQDRVMFDLRAARVESVGEAWLSYFESGPLRAGLAALGFAEIEDLGPREIAARYFPDRARAARERGGHIVHAATVLSPA
ncbi:MAG: class I SAM-dependent methyltransferase [Terriglobales bacterium]